MIHKNGTVYQGSFFNGLKNDDDATEMFFSNENFDGMFLNGVYLGKKFWCNFKYALIFL